MKNIFKIFATILMALTVVSCSEFLNRPTEDSLSSATYYQNDAQVEQGVNYLYNSPWYDIIRFFIYGGETMAGNVFEGSSNYITLTVNGTDADLKNMSYALWSVNAHCNTVIQNIQNSTGSASKAVKDRAIGEALVWKAMAYFFLVRTFGDVPIIHDNVAIIKENSYNDVFKVQKADVYDYVIMTLEEALKYLPKNNYIGKKPRIDYYAAKALLAKAYLTKAGVSGTLAEADLIKARDYALEVIEESGRTLTPKYSDVFRLSPEVYNQTGECLISWLWTATPQAWTAQNSIQCDVGLVGFDEFGDLWGDWKGPSVDLQDLFGVSASENPQSRVNKDDRRQATMMMFGDKYDYFWTDMGGFDFYRFFYDSDYSPNPTSGAFGCGTGANFAKHLYGDTADHVAAVGHSPAYMYNSLPTHILRLADVYLIYAEACLLTNDAATALTYVNKVRQRAHAADLPAVTIKDIWKERRLELSLEGDNWYDFVRRSYYEMNTVIAEIKAQRRSVYGGLDDAYKSFVCDEKGNYVGPGANAWDASGISYDNTQYQLTDVKPEMFTMPFPTEDVVLNPNVASTAEPIHVDVRETYSYNF